MPPLVLRSVVVHDGRKPCYLVTSVLDDKQLSDEQVAQICPASLGDEGVLPALGTRPSSSKSLRSKSAENAQVEDQVVTPGILGDGAKYQVGTYPRGTAHPED